MAYLNWQGLDAETVGGDAQSHHRGTGVEGLRLVEDEVADAVVDLSAAIVLDTLQGMGMVAHEHVGAGMHEHVGIMALAGYGLQLVLLTPMEADDDDGGGVLLA